MVTQKLLEQNLSFLSKDWLIAIPSKKRTYRSQHGKAQESSFIPLVGGIPPASGVAASSDLYLVAFDIS